MNERPHHIHTCKHTCKDNNTTDTLLLIRCYLLASLLASLLTGLVGWLWLIWIRSNDATNKVFSFVFIPNVFTVERLMLCATVCASQCDAILVVFSLFVLRFIRTRFELWVCSFRFCTYHRYCNVYMYFAWYILNWCVCVRVCVSLIFLQFTCASHIWHVKGNESL